MSQPNTRSRRRIVFQVSVLALLLAIGFRVSVESSSRSPNSVLNDALVRGADRLLALQRPDGLWPSELSGSGDLSGSGRSGRALLSAWKTTRDARYLAAARHAADAIVPRMPRLERAPSLGNMMFLAELSEVTGDPQFADVARQTWAKRLTVAERADGAVAAKTLLSRRNSTAWLDGTWRNYLLSRAADEVELGRLLGEKKWADDYAVAAARSWAPKRDYDFWASATSGMVLALASSDSPEARRLLDVELSMLRQDELAPGLAWSDTPYDSYVYGSETAALLRGLVATATADSRQAATDGALLIAARQASHGGWGEVLSLFDQVAAEGSADAPPAELAAQETPELDAHLVLALSELLRMRVASVPNA